MKLRRYESSDIKEIIELFYNTVHFISARDYNALQLDVWAPKEIDHSKWDESLLEHYAVVMEEESKIIGFGDIDHMGYLDRLYVHKDYQEIGVGAKIVDELENYIRKSNIEEIVTDASITARPFFEKRGYKVIKEQQVERKEQILVNFKMKKALKYKQIDKIHKSF